VRLPSIPQRVKRAIAVGVAVLLAAVPVREAWREARQVREPWTPLDVRFGALVRALPEAGSVGWAGEGPIEHEVVRRRILAQFALAPRALVAPREGVDAVVAWTADPARLDALAASLGLLVAARLHEGYAVLTARAR
jgi:hypothetical protein